MGGGVIESARGLLYAEADVDVTGDEGSTGCGLGPKTFRTFSSSEGVLIATSFSSVERNDGRSPFAGGDRALGPGACLSGLFDDVEGDFDGPASPWTATLRVLGRFNRLSGSGAGSTGDAVTDRDFRFRLLGLDTSSSRALSKAPQASLSSRVSRGGCGVACGSTCWPTTSWIFLAKTSRTPSRLAMFRRCCQR